MHIWKFILFAMFIMITISCSHTSVNNVIYYHAPDGIDNNHFLLNILRNSVRYVETSDVMRSNIYFIKSYKEAHKELKEIKWTGKKIFGLENSYMLSSKKNLALLLKGTSNIIPKTFVLPEEREDFIKYYLENSQGMNKNIYLEKGEGHRQTEIIMHDNVNHILNERKYRVVQEYMNNPKLYNDYKYNIRLYLFLVSDHGRLCGYLSNDGIISYTKNPYKYSTSHDDSICSFYSSVEHYNNGFPITVGQLKTVNLKRIRMKVKRMVEKIIYNKYSNHNMHCELFGVDFFETSDDDIYIIEVNKGPGMEPFNDVDKSMRLSVYNSCLDIVDFVKPDEKNMVRIL